MNLWIILIEMLVFAAIFMGILLACSLVAGAETFWQGFWLTFGLMVWIGVYDTCFLDWVLFANHTLQMFIREAQ